MPQAVMVCVRENAREYMRSHSITSHHGACTANRFGFMHNRRSGLGGVGCHVVRAQVLHAMQCVHRRRMEVAERVAVRDGRGRSARSGLIRLGVVGQ
jgi:hypothetical protein